jgi:hypothetical protein
MSVRVLAAEFARAVLDTRPSKTVEGAGNAGCWPQPMAPVRKKARGRNHRFSRIIRHSLRDGVTVSFVLFPGSGLVCPRRPQDHFCELSASVGAPEPHDFAVRNRAARQAAQPRPSLPASRSVTIGQNALCIEAGWRDTNMHFRKTKVKYFSRRDWTAESALNRFAKFDFPRTDFFLAKRPAHSDRWPSARPAGKSATQRGSAERSEPIYDDVKVLCAFGTVSAAIA